jgi:hypothetical protein
MKRVGISEYQLYGTIHDLSRSCDHQRLIGGRLRRCSLLPTLEVLLKMQTDLRVDYKVSF